MPKGVRATKTVKLTEEQQIKAAGTMAVILRTDGVAGRFINFLANQEGLDELVEAFVLSEESAS